MKPMIILRRFDTLSTTNSNEQCLEVFFYPKHNIYIVCTVPWHIRMRNTVLDAAMRRNKPAALGNQLNVMSCRFWYPVGWSPWLTLA